MAKAKAKAGPLTKAVEVHQSAAAIKSLEHMWAQAPDESSQEYNAFHMWLSGGEDRGAPPAEYLKAASRFGWAKRAIAYEKAWAMAKLDTEKAPEVQVIGNLLRILQMEVQKTLDSAAASKGSTLQFKDLLAALNLIKELQKEYLETRSEEIDLSYGTPEEIEVVLRAQEIIQEWQDRKQRGTR